MLNPTKLCQIDISVTDLGRSQRFYESVFQWKASPADLHNCIILEVPDNCPYGIALYQSLDDKKQISNSITLYFATNNAHEIAEKAVSFGGKKTKTRNIPRYGQVVYIEDPDQNIFGLFQSP